MELTQIFSQLFMLIFILVYSVLAIFLLLESCRQFFGWRFKDPRNQS